MRTLCLLFIIIFIGTVKAQTPDLTGTWQGILTQPNSNTLSDNYAFWFSLEQKGNLITGFSRIEVTNTSNFGIIELKGEIDQNNFNFEESKITDETSMLKN